jgi:hypothetical protein
MESSREMVTIADLRQRVQHPVRQYNDVAGLVVGDHVSILVTKFFVERGISPTVATLSMLVFGVSGSLFVLRGGWLAVLGFACVFLYYVFDCVDGEVARFHKGEKLVWGYYDFLFHLAVKSSFFVCLGIYAARTTGEPVVFLFGLFALLAVLFQKFLQDVSSMLVCRYVFLSTNDSRERFIAQLTEGADPATLAVDGDLPGEQRPFAFHGFLPSVRAVATNFDLSTLFFLAAAIADLLTPPFRLLGWNADWKTALLVFYGIVMPLDFVDRLIHHARKDSFRAECRRLLRRAHHFRLPR